MVRLRYLIVLLLVAGACGDINDPTLIAPGESPAESRRPLAPFYGADHPNRIPGEFLIRFEPNTPEHAAVATNMATAHGGSVVATWRSINGFWGRFPEEAVDGIRRNPNVKYVRANVSASSSSGASTQDVSSGNWGLDRIDQRALPLDDQYTYARDGTGVHIWVVGTGVDGSEPDLQGRFDAVNSFSVTGLPLFDPCRTHETTIAVMAAGSTYGVAKDAQINVAQIARQSDCKDISAGAAVTAFDWISLPSSPRPAVVVFSWDFGTACSWWQEFWNALTHNCDPHTEVEDAIEATVASGIPVVIAAGNKGANVCDYVPQRHPDVVAVGASNSSDERVVQSASWPVVDWESNYGSCLDIFAPGLSLKSGPMRWSKGTSHAAPLVAGVLALLLEDHSGPVAVSKLYAGATEGALSNIGSGSPNRLLYSFLPKLSVGIAGPSDIWAPGEFQWHANASGGTETYVSYLWETKEDLGYSTPWYTRGIGSSLTLPIDDLAATSFWIRVTVTSPAGTQASSIMYVKNHIDPEDCGMDICPS